MKLTAIIAPLFAASILLCGFKTNSQKDVGQSKNAETQQQGSQPKLSAQPSIPAQPTNENTDHGRGAYNPDQNQKVIVVSVPEVRIDQRKDKLDWAVLICTVILTIVGIAGTCLALQTLRAIRIEVKAAVISLQHSSRLARAAQGTAHAARANADAANKNASALINSERAWVMVEVVWVSSESGRLLTTSRPVNDGIASNTQVYVNLICVNRGKSPAWIVEQTGKAEISGGFYGPDLSTVNDSEIDRRLMSLGPRGTPEARTERSIKLYAPGLPGNKYVLVYGVVKYRDPFTPAGELKRNLVWILHFGDAPKRPAVPYRAAQLQ